MNKTVIIVGSVLVLGVGAYFFFKPKKSVTTGSGTTGSGTTGTDTTENPSNTGFQSTDPVLNTPIKENVKTVSDKDLKEIQLLRDIILSDMRRKGTYRKSASRNAVQSDINQNTEKLKALGYTLDINRNLTKV